MQRLGVARLGEARRASNCTQVLTNTGLVTLHLGQFALLEERLLLMTLHLVDLYVRPVLGRPRFQRRVRLLHL